MSQQKTKIQDDIVPFDKEFYVKLITKALAYNRFIESRIIVLTTVLFLAGVACIVAALVTNQMLLFVPPAFTMIFFFKPLRELRRMKNENILLVTVPSLVEKLPPQDAAAQIRKLLDGLKK